MELKRFKEKNRKKESMILFTILCILLIGGVFFYSSFALFEVKENFNIIKGNIENPGDLYFAYYIDDVVTTEMPNKDSGYTLSSKSSCTNGVTISFDDENWTAIINYSNYKRETNGRTKCTLYFEEASNGILRTISSTDSKGMWQYKGQITKVIIENELKPKEGAIANFDESSKQDKSVMSYIFENEKENETEETTYTAYLQSNEKLYLSSGENLFYNFQKLETIEGMRYIDTSNVSNMRFMFNWCKSLTDLDVSNFSTEKVTNMSYMFSNCGSLTTLDVSNFNTSNTTDMSYMFQSCRRLTTLDLSNFNVSNVTNMSYMFATCSRLVTLNVSNFNTEKVTNMTLMFYYCIGLTTLDVSSFNTSNVTDMDSMFYYCNKLTTLDLSNFDTSNVTNMGSMFASCSSLTTLNVSNFNTSNVTDMDSMFASCSSLTSLDLNSFDTRKVKGNNLNDGFGSMFSWCSSLTTINYGENFIYANNANIRNMFSNCPANKPTHESWSGITL